jgi:hypothetical protein
MSYCRFGEGDVYVFMNVAGWLECCACSLAKTEDSVVFKAKSTQQMVDHLEKHIDDGDRVPQGIFYDLWRDDEENFPKGQKIRQKERKEALNSLIQIGQKIREEDPELFDANEHWINNPLISPISKLDMLKDWEFRIRKEERKEALSENFDFTFQEIVRTKNPIFRVIGNISGVIAGFFLTLEIKWGDMYKMEFEEKLPKK